MGPGDGHPSAVPGSRRGALMRRLRGWLVRLTGLFQKERRDNELAAEIESHLQIHMDDNLRAGMSPEGARRNALIKLGGVEQTMESYRDQQGLPMIETMLQDLRFGFRMLRRSPGFTVLVILCLTLGIGANAAVFSWVEGILLRPYPLVSHQERLVALSGTVRDERDETSWPDLLDVQRSCKLCETLFVSKITGATLGIGERAQVLTGSIVSAIYFNAIVVQPNFVRCFYTR